ncbi:hypothetical protein [Gordonia sp. NB41Y]|uniref:hypothetical protein n=1 Tax=Gordonia sp. NB41Y TaxID=875808 RepID=UPI00034B7D5F|nr:hypothetical protein [Gordonia sp. NB41Y]WLP89538.1 hypothetical protein Q9K23_18470 [Gordonia sp. NB41Y]
MSANSHRLGDEPSRRKRALGPVMRKLFGGVPLFLTVVLVGVIAGSVTFLAVGPDKHSSAADPSTEQIESARESVASAKMMFGLMTSALGSATGSIKSISEGADSVFDAVDTAHTASGQIVSAFDAAPGTSGAGGDVRSMTVAMSNGLGDLQSLASTAGQLDSLISPVITFLQKNKVPGSGELLTNLTALQSSSREISSQLGNLDDLKKEMKTLGDAVDEASGHLDEGVAQAQQAAQQLNTGLGQLASARGDTVAAANSVSKGVGQLTTVLNSISNNLESADDNLTPAGEQGVLAAPVVQVDNSDRTATALLVGGGSALLVMILMLVVGRVLRRDGRQPGDETPDDEIAGDATPDSDDAPETEEFTALPR